MENTILRAKIILADMFGIKLHHFESYSSRRRRVVDARRFLIYFLRQELKVTYMDIIIHIPALTNHSSAIHHYNRQKGFLRVEAPTLKRYEEFRHLLLGDDTILIEKELVSLTEERIKIDKQITDLKQLLKT